MNFLYFSTIYYNFVTPFFMLNINVYLIINTILLLFLLLSIINYHNIKETILITIPIILLELLYNISFLKLFNAFLIFSSKFTEFILIIHLNEKIYTNKKSANLLMFNILWNFLLTLLSIIILFLNT